MMRVLLVLVIFLLGCSQAYAQAHIAYCDMAASTAALQNCVNKHHNAAQTRLNRIYEEVTAGLGDNSVSVEKARELQQIWLSYRDKECEWEAAQVEDSLVKIYELSCQTRMTEDRADLLEATYKNQDKAEQTELSGFPRWMNALTEDYPNIFWQFGERVRVDLNCDHSEEIVMLGTAVSRIKTLEIGETSMEKDEPGRTPHALDVVVSVTENLPTGRPVSQIFRFPVTQTLDGPALCDYKASLKILKDEVSSRSSVQAEEGNTGAACPSKVEIHAKSCTPIVLFWSGKDYSTALKTTEKDVRP